MATLEIRRFAVFQKAWEIVTTHVDQDGINFRNMTYGAIEGKLHTLADQTHAALFTPAAARMQANALEGSFVGIGAHMTMKGDEFVMVAPIRGSPAKAAGMRPTDRVIAVDGISIVGIGGMGSHQSVRGPGYGRDLPLVVLINEGSASAAEILAGALQENRRAQLVGAVTLGTGTLLQQFTLSDGAGMA